MKLENFKSSLIDHLPINNDKRKVLDRRINKLIKDPKGFLQGSYNKRSSQVREYIPIKYSSNYSFSIITEVHNSECFLDSYFKSIINQSLKFKDHIKIVCIDNGSTDKSAEIIKSWQKKYPNNITYSYQEYSSRASALNLGLNQITSDWVVFIDAEDFISRHYFSCVDKTIKSNRNIDIICTNKSSYLHQSNEFIAKYPLDYRFKNNNNLVSCHNLGNNILLNTTSNFIRTNSIPKGLIFDEELHSDFVETKFINLFLLYQTASSLLYFHRDAKYYVREYTDKNLAINALWLEIDTYSTVLEKGYLDLLIKNVHRLGYVPIHLQRTILWEVLKYIRYLLDHEERVQFLHDEDKALFLNLMQEIFLYIDEEVILNFSLANIAFAYKVGMLQLFKEVELNQQVAYIDKVDIDSNLMLIKFFSIHDPFFQLRTDSVDILPAFYQKTERVFAGVNFITEHRVWYSLTFDQGTEFLIKDSQALISYKGKRYKKIPKKMITKNTPKKHSLWVFMDRDDRAGDNAEFMYEFVKNSYPNQDICFVINEDAQDWNRLTLKNFNLIAHGSTTHREVLDNCSMLISSQTNRIIEPFRNINKGYKIVFLQHGVIKDDMSNWLNRIELDLMLTSTLGEYKSITDLDSHYKYGKKEIKLTGLPRFDSLYKQKEAFKNQVFIMFTWRKAIAGAFVDNEKSQREINDDFTDTNYFKRINGLLNSSTVAELHQKYGTRFLLCPHPNMDDYIDCFNLPSYIDVASNKKTIHQMVNESFMLLTDYSSIAFDFAYQEKPVLYYQFDQKQMYDGSHTYTEGYFDYVRDGFGPIITEEKILISQLEKILAAGGTLSEPYATRIKETFAYHDANNCQRVYDAIINLNTPYNEAITIDYLINHAQKALARESWDTALARFDSALNHPDIVQSQIETIEKLKENVIQIGYRDVPVKLANILWYEKRIGEALEKLKQVDSIELSDEILRLRVKLAILNDKFILARDSQKLLLESYHETCTIEDWQLYVQLAGV